MRFVIQRVTKASCTVDKTVTGQIKNGLCVFIGVSNDDTTQIADKMISKLINMRIFADSEGKTNLSLKDVDGQLLLISQFTLYANCRKGNRPSFTDAGNPELANQLYEYCIEQTKKEIDVVQTGIFGADMQIELNNDGPFTIVLDSNEICHYHTVIDYGFLCRTCSFLGLSVFHDMVFCRNILPLSTHDLAS